jgi:TolB-like protein/tRNA A-37 threonylcarbamoyl transferase component Bud32/Flp pilus assembly protein TadD
MIGQTLGHYRLVEELGVGGMGEVYRARDESLDRDVAVKVIRQGALVDDIARRRLRKEARALSKLSHPNIEFLFEFNSEGPVEFLAVEYVAGISLSERLTQEPLPEKEIVRLGVQLADGLAAAHGCGVVHCDLKPDNLRITPEGRLKIIDFGIAKLLRPTGRTRGLDTTTASTSGDQAAVGTLPYMAPEQLRAEATDGRTDIYAAGVVLYEAVTGRRPFGGEATPALIDEILHQPPVSPRALNSRASPELERIILKCLQKEPENRYQSAQELEVDLRQLAGPGTAAQVPPAGRVRVLRLAGAIAIFVVALVAMLVRSNIGNWWERLQGKASVGRIESLAVLPLENLSRDPEQDYFADGMTEELITDLSKISALKVISRTSVMQYRGAKKPLPQIAKELNVDAIIEGSVLRAEGRVRITAKLVEAATDRDLWAQSYDRDLKDVLALQSEVARAIVEEIQVKLSPQEQNRLLTVRAVKPDAYEAYLKGRYFWNKRDREGVMKGLEYFQRAVELDPTYALAHTGVADSYLILGTYDWLSPREALPKAKAAALKALEIDGNLAEAHTSLSQIEQLDWDWEGTEVEFKKALTLNPGYATAHQWYSYFLSNMGRDEEAIREARRAAELDPLSPVISSHVGQTLYYARRYDEARRALERTLELSQDSYLPRYFLGLVYIQDHKLEEGIAKLQEAAHLSPGDDATNATLSYAYALAGRRGESQEVLTELREQAGKRYVSPCLIALVYVGLGNKEEAFGWLEQAYKQRDGELPWVGMEPMFDPLRSDTRLRALLRRMNLPR